MLKRRNITVTQGAGPQDPENLLADVKRESLDEGLGERRVKKNRETERRRMEKLYETTRQRKQTKLF